MTTDRSTDGDRDIETNQLPAAIAATIREFTELRAVSARRSDGVTVLVEPADQPSALDGDVLRLEGAVSLSEPAPGLVLLCSVGALSTFRDESAVRSRSAFASSVQWLVSEACRNGVDVRGSWSLRTEETFPDFEVEILEVEKPIRRDESS
ncbi:hypothetical protein [Natronococcus occultus]|uniref:Uncharacterized protein n=1 Tax=Natronococcus occultus SP4 TaxID=694430 RepID=L0JW92_9EURY|nr:hypothetical protein [Natronococcus occultus]AGB36138.1 hypothetical protein Natoc_0263 [Natronococcus occultus SP4]